MESLTQSFIGLVDIASQSITLVLMIFIIIMAVTIPLAFIKKMTNKLYKNDTPQDVKDIDFTEGQNEAVEKTAGNEYPYIKPYLLTKREWSFYRELRPITNKYKLHILSKVRMADLVQVKKGLVGKEFQEAFDQIKSKHVDFVLANPSNLAILCVIELDDNSHDDINVQQSDYFKDQTFKTIGLPILRVKNISGLEELICSTLLINQKTSQPTQNTSYNRV